MIQFYIRIHSRGRFFCEIIKFPACYPTSRLALPTEFGMKSHENVFVVDMHIHIYYFSDERTPTSRSL